jgi:DNA-binding SARP family transcriptional activator/TolB-like protein
MELRIGVLGSFVCAVDGRKLDRLPRKACALMAFLATKLDQPVSREYIGELLWPDRELGLGLHGVRNSLLAIRSSLGEGASYPIGGTATSVRLSDALVDLDVLEQSVNTDDLGRLERAAALYRDDFLLDLRVGSEAFQDWVAIERSRARALASRVFERLILAQQHAGQHEAAIRSAERLVGIDKLSEAAHRQLMMAYVRGGRRGEALRHYGRCSDLLRYELCVEPGPETQELYAEIKAAKPAKGARLSRGGQSLKLDSAAPRWPLLTPKLVVGMEPVRYLGSDAAQSRMAEWLTDDLVTDLFAGLRGVELAYATSSQDPCWWLRTPEVDYVLSVGIQPAANSHLRLNARLIEAHTRKVRWVRRIETQADPPPSSKPNLTKELVDDMQFALVVDTARRSLMDREEHFSPEELLAKSRRALGSQSTPTSTREAQEWLLNALSIDAANIEALVTLARTCHHIGSQPGWSDRWTSQAAFDIGRTAASKALEFEPGHAEAQCFKGMLCSSSGELEIAAHTLSRAVEVNDKLAIAHAFGGYNAAFLGHAERTLPSVEKAVRLGGEDRRQTVWWFFAGFGELLLGRPANSVCFLEKSLDRNPNYGTAQLFLAVALRQSCRTAEAARMMNSFKRNCPGYDRETFTAQWLSRSSSSSYRAQVAPVLEGARELGLP